MINLSVEDYDGLTAGATVIRSDEDGPRLLSASDGRIVKVMRSRGFLSADTFGGAARRFVANAARLHELGIRAPEPDGPFRCKSVKGHIVMYQRLNHETIRDEHARDNTPEDMLLRLPAFISELHDKGVFFEALNLGNIIYSADQPYGLIDIDAVSFSGSPLNARKRVTNLIELMSDSGDRQILVDYGLERLIAEYLDNCGMQHADRVSLVEKLRDEASELEPVSVACNKLLERSSG